MGMQRVDSKEFLTSDFHFNTVVQVIARLFHVWELGGQVIFSHATCIHMPIFIWTSIQHFQSNVCVMHYVQYFSYSTACKMTDITLQL